MIKCKVCEKEFVRLVPTHLRTHGIKDLIEYYEKYPEENPNYEPPAYDAAADMAALLATPVKE